MSKGETSTNGLGPYLDWDDVWWTIQPQGWTADPRAPSPLRCLASFKPQNKSN
jgi:hypothetical protein